MERSREMDADHRHHGDGHHQPDHHQPDRHQADRHQTDHHQPDRHQTDRHQPDHHQAGHRHQHPDHNQPAAQQGWTPGAPIYHVPSHQHPGKPSPYQAQQQVAPSPYYGYPQQAPQYQGVPPPYGYPSSGPVIMTAMAPVPTGQPLSSPPPSYLAWSIVNLIVGFICSWIGMIVAIVAIVASNQVTRYSQYGDSVAACRTSRSVKSYNTASTIFNGIGIGITGLVIWKVVAIFTIY